MSGVNSRKSLDLATIFDHYGEGFMSKHPMCGVQLKAIQSIRTCRTAHLGGYVNQCDTCGHKKVGFKSCRNRNCNKCQYVKGQVWVDQLQHNLASCRYFHMVFTIPQELHQLFYLNQSLCYTMLFQGSAETVLKMAANPDFLGAQTGAVSLLHTWGESLTYHPHIHMLVPAGGLSEDGMEWIASKKKFFLPIKEVSKVFRGILCKKLSNGVSKGEILLPRGSVSMAELKQQLYSKKWHVFISKARGSSHSIVRYFGKYTHRVAISNSRLVSDKNGRVYFRSKNYRSRLSKGFISLKGEEFIGRFVRHILPSGFYKIRYFGLLASTNSARKAQSMALMHHPQSISIFKGLSPVEILQVLTGKGPEQCDKCKKGKLLPHTILDPV